MITHQFIFFKSSEINSKSSLIMNPIRRYILCISLCACLMHSVAVGALSVEHSFDGQNFKRVASLELSEVRLSLTYIYYIHRMRHKEVFGI